MHFSSLVSTAAIIAAAAAPVSAASFAPVQMPKSNLDGVHNNSYWDSSSFERLQPPQAKVAKVCGVASFYGVGDGFAGRRTASGSIFDPHAMTTAHRSLPFGARIRVTNQANGKSVIVVGTDRGPFVAGRVLDLSYGAFARIASPSQGVANVCYARIS
jgi:rare lipoprotein A (peptidoglycan hydrolase)